MKPGRVLGFFFCAGGVVKGMQNVLAAGLLAAAGVAHAAPVVMSPEWAKEMCEAWNRDATLTGKLVESGWAKNDLGRGYKVMQIHRSDCKDSARVELRVSVQGGKAVCVYGGKGESRLDSAADYAMWSTTEYWREMGMGMYGPMRAMMVGRLKFDGPYGEAMSNMGPFESFLVLVGKVPGETTACPGQ
jgi:putative sterol carrier protein